MHFLVQPKNCFAFNDLQLCKFSAHTKNQCFLHFRRSYFFLCQLMSKYEVYYKFNIVRTTISYQVSFGANINLITVRQCRIIRVVNIFGHAKYFCWLHDTFQTFWAYFSNQIDFNLKLDSFQIVSNYLSNSLKNLSFGLQKFFGGWLWYLLYNDDVIEITLKGRVFNLYIIAESSSNVFEPRLSEL